MSHRKAYLRGGLLFEKHHTEPILVNPTQLTFYRKLNLTLLLQTDQLLQHYTKSYMSFCDYIRGAKKIQPNYNDEKEYFRLPLKYTLNDAPLACLKSQGKLPEIKTSKQKDDIKLFSSRHSITTFPAGITYDSTEQSFLYMSSKDIVQFSKATFPQMSFEQNKTDIFLNIQDPTTHSRARVHKLVYEFKPNRDPRLTMYGQNTYNNWFDVICQTINIDENTAIESNILMKMISHTCLRDNKGLNATTQLLSNELRNFIGPQLKNRNPRQTDKQNQTIECYTDICTQLATTLKLIDLHSDYFSIYNYSLPHLKIFTIFSTLKANNFTSITTFEQYFDLLMQPKLNTQKISQNPQADLIQLFATDFFDKSNEPGFALLVRPFKRNSTFLTNIEKWAEAKNSTKFFVDHFEAKHRRPKRFALAVGGGIMLANTVSSATTGDAPLSWFGNVMSSALGLATRSDINTVMSHLQQHGHALSDLSINQEQLFESYVQVRKNVASLHDHTTQLEYSVANMAIELDNKLAIKHLQFIMQLTMLKIAESFTNAIQHQPSSYIFSQDELDIIASRYATNKIFLSTNMRDVHVNVLKNATEILFTFTIPVMDDRALFNFYEVKQFPIFQNNLSYFANIDLQYFAITSNTNEYSILSPSEYFICLTNKQCQISDVIHPINKDAHCTVQTFQENAILCNLQQTEQIQKPFFAFYSNKTFFSVPNALTIRITCQENSFNFVTDTQSKILTGTGYIEIKPSCSIVLPDNRKYFSNPILEAEYLENAHMMNILEESHPQIVNFTFQIPEPKITTTLATPVLKSINLPFIEQIYQEISTPAKALSTSIIFLIIILIIIFIFVLLCMTSKCFRVWFKTCTFMKNPKNWWTNYKSYDLTTFDKLKSSQFFKRKFQKFRKSENTPNPRTSTPNELPDPEIMQYNDQNAPTYVRYADSNLYPNFVYNPDIIQTFTTQPTTGTIV